MNCLGKERSVDFSFKNLSRLSSDDVPEGVVSANLSNNAFQKLENLPNLQSVLKLDLSNNNLCRVISISHLTFLEVLDLSSNKISNVEGLNELVNLKSLSLAKNGLQRFSLDKLNRLAVLNLSENKFASLPKVSCLFMLETLLLNGNQIVSLESAPHNLPVCSLKVLELASNGICDITQVRFLTCLQRLEQLTIQGNPCVAFSNSKVVFNYRPYLICWCTGLQAIDGSSVEETEALKGEWLFCQGKGRQFAPGQHLKAVEYLSVHCSACDDTVVDELKLRNVLAKRKKYLQEQENFMSTSCSAATSTPKVCQAQSSLDSRLSNFLPAECFTPQDARNKENIAQHSASSPEVLKSTSSCISPAAKSAAVPVMRNAYEEYDDRPVSVALRSPFGVFEPSTSCLLRPCSFPSTSAIRTPECSDFDLSRTPKRNFRSMAESPFKRSKFGLSSSGGATDIANEANASVDDEVSVSSTSSSRLQRRRWELSAASVPPLIKAKTETPTNSPRSLGFAAYMKNAHHLAAKPPHGDLSSCSANQSHGATQESDVREASAVKIQALWRGYRCRTNDVFVQRAFAELRWRRTDTRALQALSELQECRQELSKEKEIVGTLVEVVKRMSLEIDDLKRWKASFGSANLVIASASVDATDDGSTLLAPSQIALTDNGSNAVQTCGEHSNKLPASESTAVQSNLESEKKAEDISDSGLSLPLSPDNISELPLVSDLKFHWRDSCSGIFSWKCPLPEDQIANFEILFDEESHGTVGNKQNKALISDLEEDVEYRICIKYFTSDGRESRVSSSIVILKLSNDNELSMTPPHSQQQVIREANWFEANEKECFGCVNDSGDEAEDLVSQIASDSTSRSHCTDMPGERSSFCGGNHALAGEHTLGDEFISQQFVDPLLTNDISSI